MLKGHGKKYISDKNKNIIYGQIYDEIEDKNKDIKNLSITKEHEDGKEIIIKKDAKNVK